MAGVPTERAIWLAQCVLPHERALRAWLARRRLADLDLDDVVQEAYAVLAELESVSHIRSPRTYLFSVAHSIVLQRVRQMRVVSIEAVAELERLDIHSVEGSPEQAVADFQDLRRIAQFIGGLPRKCREAFVLRKIEGLSQREIAQRMRISENTVEKHIGKALRALMDVARNPVASRGNGGSEMRHTAGKERSEGQHEE